MKKFRKIVAIQGDAIQAINVKTDTTLLLALEAQRRGYKIYYYETKDLTFSNNAVYALSKEVEFNKNKNKFYSIKGLKLLNLSKAKFILMRQNPPFNMNYITATFLLEKISKKTEIINNPTAVRNMPEKLCSIDFLKLMPPTIFTKSIDEIYKFNKRYKKIVLKPTHGYGGKNILFISKNLEKSKIKNYLKKHEHVMVQKFIPEIKYGDKRIFIIGGVIKGAIKRVPKQGSIVSNIGQGGKALETTLTKREFYIAKIVARNLKKRKIFFAGIDLIGNYLTGDINITSPTGIKNFKDLTGKDLSIDFWNYLEKNKLK
jgi:glutathione synthase